MINLNGKWKVFGALLAIALIIGVLAVQVPSSESAANGSHNTLYSRMLMMPVTVDGVIGTSEWADAYRTNISIGTDPLISSSEIWIKNDESYLYMAIKFAGVAEGIAFYFDEEHDHQLTNYGEDQKWFVLTPIIQGWFDGSWIEAEWRGDDDLSPTGLQGPFLGAWTYSARLWNLEWKMPLDSPDPLDLNVESGSTLGFMIDTFRLGVYPAGANAHNAGTWDDLFVKRVYSAAVPFVHSDGVGAEAYLSVVNTGMDTSIILLRFYNRTGSLVGYVGGLFGVPQARYGGYVENLFYDPFVGSIIVTSDQPFSHALDQRFVTTLVGDRYDGSIHYLCKGRRHWINSADAFNAYGFSWTRIHWVGTPPAVIGAKPSQLILAYTQGYDLDGTKPLPS